MGRVRTEVRVNGGVCWTLFDSGAENAYIVRELGKQLDPKRLPEGRRWKSRLGGRAHRIRQDCRLVAKVEGKLVMVQAYLVDVIGFDKRAKRPIEILFGAHAMQQWGIELDLKHERLDMSRYPDEFVEF